MNVNILEIFADCGIVGEFLVSLFAFFQLVNPLKPFHNKGRNFPVDVKIFHISCSIFCHPCSFSRQRIQSFANISAGHMQVKGKVLALKRQELQKEAERDYGAFEHPGLDFSTSLIK
jgi:hypothetical protein